MAVEVLPAEEVARAPGGHLAGAEVLELGAVLGASDLAAAQEALAPEAVLVAAERPDHPATRAPRMPRRMAVTTRHP